MLHLRTNRSSSVHSLRFSPDGQTLVSLSRRRGDPLLWDLTTLQATVLTGHRSNVVAVAFAPDGQLMASASSLGELLLHQRKQTDGSWKELARFELRRLGDCLPVQIVFHPQGRLLVTNLVSNLQTNRRHTWPDRDLVFSLIDLETRKVKFLPHQHQSAVAVLAFSPDGTLLASGSIDKTVRLLRMDGGVSEILPQNMKVHYLAFSPDGQTLAVGAPRGLVRMWDLHTWTNRGNLKGLTPLLHALAFSPDNRFLATASGQGLIQFWDLCGQPTRTSFDWGIGTVHCVAFAPDGMRAAAGGDGQIVIWDIDDWDL
jgi:WD40 repeat protein